MNLFQLDLNPTQVFCPRHRAPFDPLWPAGYAEFAVAGIHVLVNELDRDISTDEGRDAFTAELSRKPLCCQLGEGYLLELLLETQRVQNLWSEATCALCRKKARGAPFAQPGYATTYNHLCLQCLVLGLPSDPSALN